jgi:hypothetical protein
LPRLFSPTRTLRSLKGYREAVYAISLPRNHAKSPPELAAANDIAGDSGADFDPWIAA